MKRLLGLMLIAFGTYAPARACDVCGCSASNQYLGILPQQRLDFVGLQYMYSTFTSNVPSVFDGKPSDHSAEYYNTMQVWGRYNIGKRLQVFAFVPYHNNRDREDSAFTSSGLGDISFLVNRIMIKDDNPAKKWGQQLQAGGGVKLPTGENTGITTLDKEGLPNIQPGTGSWDFIVNANYTVRHNKSGINLDAAYTFTTANKYDYKYGNRLNAGLLGFYSWQLNAVNILPQAGLRYEYTLHDYDSYSKKWLNTQSGGYLCYATVGVQAYYKRIGMRVTYQLPISQYYGAGYVTAQQKTEAGVFLLF